MNSGETQGTEFDYQSRFVAALSDNYNPELFKKIQADLKVVSKDSIADLNENARALRVLQQTGVDASAGVKLLSTSMAASVMGETDMKTATEDLVSVLEVFNLHSQDPNEFASSYKKTGDVIAWVSKNTKANFHDVAESLKGVVGVAQQYGVTVEEVAALTTMLGKQGITGSRAGTYTRSAIESIYTDNSQRANRVKDQLGFDAYDATTGKVKNLTQALTELVGKLKEYDPKSQAAMIDALFPAWGAKAFRTVNNDLDQFISLLGEAKNQSGELERFMTPMMESVSFQFKQLQAEWNNLFTNSLNADTLVEPIKKLKEAVADPGLSGSLTTLVALSVDVLSGFAYLAKGLGFVAMSFRALGSDIAAAAAIGVESANILKNTSMSGSAATLATGGNPVTEVKNSMQAIRSIKAEWAKDQVQIAEDYFNPQKATAASVKKSVESDIIKIREGQAERMQAFRAVQAAIIKEHGNTEKARALWEKAWDDLNAEPKTKTGTKVYNERASRTSERLARQAQREAHDEALAEFENIKRIGNAKIQAEADNFNRYKQLIDQRVSLGALAQDAANNLLATEQAASDKRVKMAALEELTNLNQFANTNKLTDADKVRLQTEREAIAVRLRKIEADSAHTLQMRQERAELERLSLARKVAGDISSMNEAEALRRNREREDFDRKLVVDPVGNAGQDAYRAAYDNGKSKMQEYAAGVTQAKKAMDDLREALRQSSIPAAEQTELLAAQELKVRDATKAYDEFKVALDSSAQSARAAAEQMASDSATWQYGVKSAMAEYVRSIGTAAEQSNRLVSTSFKGMEDSLVNFVKTGKMDFKSLAATIIEELIRIQIQQSMLKMFGGGVEGGGGLFGSLFSGISSLFGGGSGSFMNGQAISGSVWDMQSAAMLSANGNAFGLGGVHAFAKGGAFTNSVVSSPTYFKFAKGGSFGLGLMGEAGDEAVMPLARDSQGRLGVRSSGGTSAAPITNIVNITVQGGDDADKTGDIISAKVLETMKSIADQRIINSTRLGGVLNRVNG